jgi:Trk-type K+ transport system membrane component
MLAEMFTRTDLVVFAALFVGGIPYAVLLEVWRQRYPQSFEVLTWLQVMVGVGYVVIALAFILPLDYWLHVLFAFGFAAIPIIFRSVIIHAINQRDMEE